MSNQDSERAKELRKLEHELGKLNAQVKTLSPEAREHRAIAVREAVQQNGTWSEQVDAPVLADFVSGRVGLEELAKHFADRV